MDPTQTSYLLQKVAPIIIRELGPKVEPLIAEKLVMPIAKKVGPPLAKKIGMPIARRAGTVLINKLGYPLVNKVLKVNLSPSQNLLTNLGAPAKTEPAQGNIPKKAKAKKQRKSLKQLITPRKTIKQNNGNQFTPSVIPQIPLQAPQTPQTPQAPQFPPFPPQAPLLNQQPVQNNEYTYFNNNSSLLFGRKRQYGQDPE